MFYFVLAAVVLVALFLIFRDDHDRRYDQRGGSGRQYLAEMTEKPVPASAMGVTVFPPTPPDCPRRRRRACT